MTVCVSVYSACDAGQHKEDLLASPSNVAQTHEQPDHEVGEEFVCIILSRKRAVEGTQRVTLFTWQVKLTN